MKKLLPILLILFCSITSKAQITFSVPSYYAVGQGPRSIVSADFNNDGMIDLATSDYASQSISILINNGAGGFLPVSYLPVGVTPTCIVCSDFNGDGAMDLAIDNKDPFTGAGIISVVLGNGNGTFAAPTNYASLIKPYTLVYADFNGDNIDDLATTDSSGVSILLGDGLGDFITDTSVIIMNHTFYMAVDDFNNDGIPDLVIPNAPPTYGVSLLFGSGNGTFSMSTLSFPAGSPFTSPSATASGDFNGDGNKDIVIAGYYAGNIISIFSGNGAGGFSGPINYTLGAAYPSIGGAKNYKQCRSQW